MYSGGGTFHHLAQTRDRRRNTGRARVGGEAACRPTDGEATGVPPTMDVESQDGKGGRPTREWRCAIRDAHRDVAFLGWQALGWQSWRPRSPFEESAVKGNGERFTWVGGGRCMLYGCNGHSETILKQTRDYQGFTAVCTMCSVQCNIQCVYSVI